MQENIDPNAALLTSTQLYRVWRQKEEGANDSATSAESLEVKAALEKCKTEGDINGLTTVRSSIEEMNTLFLLHVSQLPAYDQQNYQKVLSSLIFSLG